MGQFFLEYILALWEWKDQMRLADLSLSTQAADQVMDHEGKEVVVHPLFPTILLPGQQWVYLLAYRRVLVLQH